MTIRIIQYENPPGTTGWDDQKPFGGDALSDLIRSDDDFSFADKSRFVLDASGFSGLSGTFKGAFTYSGDDVFGKIESIVMTYGTDTFHTWKNVNWNLARVTAAVDKFDAGDKDAIDDFLAGFDYHFDIHRSSSYTFVMATEQGDLVTAQTPNASGSATVFTYGGKDIIKLQNLDKTTYVDSGKGDDTVKMGSGADQVRSQAGNDIIRGGAGSDDLDGQRGNDKIYGQGGNDAYLTGGADNDKVWGGSGDDTIIDHRGANNRLFGQAGDDAIDGRGVLNGGQGNDTLTGRGRLVGGKDDDILSGTGVDKKDVFDFRLSGATGFGDDKVDQYDYDFGISGLGDADALWFDKGVDVTFRFLENKGAVLLTAKLNGEVVGTVTFDQDFDTTTATGLIAGLQNDLVFL